MAATLPPPVPAEPTVVARGRIAGGWWRIPLVLMILVVIFGVTYLLAWFDARNLTTDFMAHANASYEEGNYLEALVGSREYDPELQQNVVYGGYADVVRIWRHEQARPVPDEVALARERIDEIIAEHITIAEAESFVQRNIGRSNPYLGLIFLRLGELYEEEGDLRSAEDIYEEFPSLFPNETELIERANANLARLQQE
jgi:tetratricopeptide (TPR) repeat protein